MTAKVVEQAEVVLGRVIDSESRGFEFEWLAESDYFPKYGDDYATEEDYDAAWKEFRERFEAAVGEVAGDWGEPVFSGRATDCPQWWGAALGEELAYWHRGEFVVCVYLGQEDLELPFVVGVAAFHEGYSWNSRPDE